MDKGPRRGRDDPAAGTSLTLVVLVGADKNDETLGVAQHPDALIGIDAIA